MISINFDNNNNRYKNNINSDTNPIFSFIGTLVVGGALLGGGIAIKNSYEYQDSLRTVKNFPATISKITKYSVTYEADQEDVGYGKRARSDTDYNVAPENVKKVNEYNTFNVKKTSGKNSTTKELLQIAAVEKTVSEIEVIIVQNGVTSTARMSQNNFTRNITEKEIGSQINIEFNPTDLTNISMPVEGMTWGQSAGSWAMISFGILFLIISLVILYSIAAPKFFPKKI